jgi:hypothetical protein
MGSTVAVLDATGRARPSHSAITTWDTVRAVDIGRPIAVVDGIGTGCVRLVAQTGLQLPQLARKILTTFLLRLKVGSLFLEIFCHASQSFCYFRVIGLTPLRVILHTGIDNVPRIAPLGIVPLRVVLVQGLALLFGEFEYW